MKRWPLQSRAEYEQIQCARTQAKWTLNGITREEVEWIHARVPPRIAQGPILCLGVRNGLEVDLFREVFGRVPAGEGWDGGHTPASPPRVDLIEVQGVELHQQGARSDVWVGSFDAMPAEWAGRYALLYSNALDHAYDPVETAREWRRVAQPGAILALTLDLVTPPTETDPIAHITPSDLAAWFGGERLTAEWAVSHEATEGAPLRVLWRLP